MRLTKELRTAIIDGSPEERRYICEKSFLGFAFYYFTDYFFYEIAPFHNEFASDAEQLASGKIPAAAWIAFRESAKTSFAKILLAWLICYKKRTYIGWDSYDKSNSENALLDVILELQTNRDLIRDFGHLYTEKRTDDEKKMKRVNQFITKNDIMVRAFSTQESPRGWLYGNQRPDFVIFDDCENFKTILSNPITQKIVAHINEAKTGKAGDGVVLYLSNYIREDGVAQFMIDSVNAVKGVVRFIPVISQNKPSWPDKYTLYDKRATEVNPQRVLNNKKPKISLAAKKRELNVNGRKVFEAEMMLDPAASGFLVFDRARIDVLLPNCTKPKHDKAGFLIWEDYLPSYRYAIGADTSKGVGRDANASVLINFSTVPARQVGSYANNMIAPDTFAYELKREGEMFGDCLLAPEINNTGYATITQLKAIYNIDKIYRKRQSGTSQQIVDKPKMELGWETNGATKPDIIFQLKAAVEAGQLQIMDARILREMRRFNQADIQELTPDPEGTRHFDLLMACAIAWAMRNYAEVEQQSDYEQQPYEPTSEYESSFQSNSSSDFHPVSEM